MSKGRPRLPDGEQMVSISLRLPKWLVDWYDNDNGKLKRSAGIRRALEYYAFPDNSGEDT